MIARALLLIWEGFYIIGEVPDRGDHWAGRFADVAWVGLAALLGLWLASLGVLASGATW